MRKHTLSALCLTLAALSPLASAHQQGDWIVRGGLTTVAPDESTSNIVAGGNDLGVALNIDNDTQLGLNVAYFITDNNLVKKTYKWAPEKNIYDVVKDTYIWISKNKKELIKYF